MELLEILHILTMTLCDWTDVIIIGAGLLWECPVFFSALPVLGALA